MLERLITKELNKAEKWCSTSSKGHFLDEHALWVAARLCGVNPGKRIDEGGNDIRPIHGMHVHNRYFLSDADRGFWCQIIPPLLEMVPKNILPRFLEMNQRANCKAL